MARNSQATVTTDHETIRRWAEERGGSPASVRGTGGGDDPGMIRLDFPGFSGADSLQPISWEEWFKAFDENKLALLHQETTAGGERSNFNKLIAREMGEKRARGVRGASRHRPQGRRRAAGRSEGRRSARRASSSSRGRTRKAATSRNRRSASSRTRSERGSRTQGRSKRASAKRSTRARATGKRGAKTQGRSSRTRRSASLTSRSSRSRRTTPVRNSRSKRGQRGGKVLVARSKIRRLKKDVRSLGSRRKAA